MTRLAAPFASTPRPGAQLRRDFFAYTIRFTGLALGAAASGAIQIQADSDFELQKLTFFNLDSAGGHQTEATRFLPATTIQITDTGTGRQLFNAPIPIPALFGDGRIPFILPTTKIFTANASVTVDIANAAVVGATGALWVNFIGSKIFAYG